MFEHRGRVEPERLPGQLQVTTKLPFRDDELADDVLASLAIFPAENDGVRLNRFKAVETKKACTKRPMLGVLFSLIIFSLIVTATSVPV